VVLYIGKLKIFTTEEITVMAHSKSISLLLLNGDVNGIIKCTVPIWTGVAYKIPRTKLDDCKNRDDLKQTGVYFLFGESDETGEPVVYIGQAGIRKNGEGILYRLQEHRRNPKKDYWTEAVVFTTSNNSLGPTEISYLENQFCNLALSIGRYDVKNGNDPTPGNITEEKESELDAFIEYAKMVIAILGYKVFTPLVQKPVEMPETEVEDIDLFLSRTIRQIDKTVNAKGRQTAEGFVVLKGSQISPVDDDTISEKMKELRKNTKVNSDYELLEDVMFNSPSSAAVFVTGKSTNGLVAWKTADGKTLKDLED
jgi:hypothetical protein